MTNTLLSYNDDKHNNDFYMPNHRRIHNMLTHIAFLFLEFRKFYNEYHLVYRPPIHILRFITVVQGYSILLNVGKQHNQYIRFKL